MDFAKREIDWVPEYYSTQVENKSVYLLCNKNVAVFIRVQHYLLLGGYGCTLSVAE